MSAGGAIIPLVAGLIAIGVVAQVAAARFRVPSVIFLITAGLILGPGLRTLSRVLELPVLEQFALTIGRLGGSGTLSAIVGLSVAIIVFEGAFHIQIEDLRGAPSATLRLVTVGAAIALVGTAGAVHFLLGAAWEVSFLVGALLVATGPTVITPILDVVPVRDRVATALETEGIVNDVTAAILAVVIFEAILTGRTAPAELVRLFASRLGIGIVVGLLVAGVVYYLVEHVDLSPSNAPRNARLLVLAGALVAFASADTIAPESGVAAVATAGIVLGNVGIPYEEDISAFKGDVTLIVLSFVFIALAALLDFRYLLDLGLRGIAVVVVVALLLRPGLVFLSMAGDRFTTGEKWFVSLVGPRGIIPASVATLFATELRGADAAEVAVADPTGAANLLVGTVFLVILATVVFEAGLAGRIANYLDVIPMRIIIVGGGKVGRTLAERLQDRGENVVIVEENDDTLEKARNAGFTVHEGDGTDTDVLRAAGAENARLVVAATGDDDANLLVAQLSKSKFDVEDVLARANNPDNVEAFEDLGVRTISSTEATAWAMDNAIERPALSRWMTALGRTGDVQEVEVTAEDVVGLTVREFDEYLPNHVLVALISRGDESEVPGPDETLQRGDHITILGRREDVREAMQRCRGDS